MKYKALEGQVSLLDDLFGPPPPEVIQSVSDAKTAPAEKAKRVTKLKVLPPLPFSDVPPVMLHKGGGR